MNGEPAHRFEGNAGVNLVDLYREIVFDALDLGGRQAINDIARRRKARETALRTVRS